MVRPALPFRGESRKGGLRFTSLFLEGTAEGGTEQAVAMMRIMDGEDPLHRVAFVEGF
jgi:hypothetical protein